MATVQVLRKEAEELEKKAREAKEKLLKGKLKELVLDCCGQLVLVIFRWWEPTATSSGGLSGHGVGDYVLLQVAYLGKLEKFFYGRNAILTHGTHVQCLEMGERIELVKGDLVSPLFPFSLFWTFADWDRPLGCSPEGDSPDKYFLGSNPVVLEIVAGNENVRQRLEGEGNDMEWYRYHRIIEKSVELLGLQL